MIYKCWLNKKTNLCEREKNSGCYENGIYPSKTVDLRDE
jgi:hypothetical protein